MDKHFWSIYAKRITSIDNEIISRTPGNFVAVLAVLHLFLLKYFPSTNLFDWMTTAIPHSDSIFYFSSFSMFIQSRISKSVVICSFCSFLCSFLLFFLFPVLFSPSVYSFYFLISLIVFFSDLLSFLFSFPITLFCLFSLMLYYYSICSLSISLHLFRSLYLILLCHLFCSCFCFLYTSSFW